MPRQAEETSRSIALGERVVPYLLRRSRRRSIGLSIDHRGLRVGAPLRTRLAEIETLIHKHADWVAKKLDEWRERRATPLAITDGMRLPYLGGTLEIRLTEGGPSLWTDGGSPSLSLPRDDPGPHLYRALRRQALAVFSERLMAQAKRFTIDAPRLTLSSARTRWGSCSLKSGIRLNWRLIHCEAALIDYVIAHELAHLTEMNHSPRFWALVECFCPNYRALQAELRNLAKTLPSFV